MQKLISTTDFVLEQKTKFDNWDKSFDATKSFWLLVDYAKFLKQPLKLGMFVPCDEKGNVLAEVYCPQNCYCGEEQTKDCKEWKYEYNRADERVLFKGFSLNKKEILPSEGVFCITKDNIQLTYFKQNNAWFLDNLRTGQTFEIKSLEMLVGYEFELKNNEISSKNSEIKDLNW